MLNGQAEQAGGTVEIASARTQGTCREDALENAIHALAQAIDRADALCIGAGAGMSASAGLTYSGERFDRLFADFKQKYGITDMYSGGFYPFKTPEEYWAWWSRHIYCNRYDQPALKAYADLLRIALGRDYFVLTTNVDHCFQNAGFDKQRLFYTQGDYGLWQCSLPCHEKTYDNEAQVREMIARQRDMRVPGELVPHCPRCGRPMTMNLRADDRFVQDEGWYAAATRYTDFLGRHETGRVLYLELGVGGNTPGIIKYPFWSRVMGNPQATYACINKGEARAPRQIMPQSILIDADIALALEMLCSACA